MFGILELSLSSKGSESHVARPLGMQKSLRLLHFLLITTRLLFQKLMQKITYTP